MKEVTFKIIGIGSIANITIYDNNKSIIYDTKIYNGKIKLCLKENNSYLLVVRAKNRVLKRVICIDKKTNKFVFCFYNRIITFLLKDYYYNLPIMKGELILWQK